MAAANRTYWTRFVSCLEFRTCHRLEYVYSGYLNLSYGYSVFFRKELNRFGTIAHILYAVLGR